MAKRGLQAAGIWMIFLIVTFPVYSAGVMAVPAVSIAKNEGNLGISGYLDAAGDTWKVDAVISGIKEETIDPKNVVMKIGSRETPFNACSSTTGGISCEYVSPLTDGVREDSYTFEVIYKYLDELLVPKEKKNADVIHADGSPPEVKSVLVSQSRVDGSVNLDFEVTDKVKAGAPAIGIKQIDIIDGETNQVLQTIASSQIGLRDVDFKYSSISEFAGKLQAELTGEGFKRIKIRAEDKLGHISEPLVASFQSDFVKPQIVQGSLNFSNLGKFMGEVIVKTDIIVDVKESRIDSVAAFSDLAALQGEEANCIEDEDVMDLLHCAWKDVEVRPSSSVSLRVIARDRFGNEANELLTKSDFTIDTDAPVIEFFGTERVFDGKSFITDGKNRLVLIANEKGAGISKNGIRANLGAFDRGSSVEPTDCEDTDSGVECWWDVDFRKSTDQVSISLSKFIDNVNNEGLRPETQLFVDKSPPVIENIELHGQDDSIGEKDYFQSSDRLKIKFRAREVNGLLVLVDVNDIIMDAELNFPERDQTRGLGDGWMSFTEDDGECSYLEGRWSCEFETETMKSGSAVDNVEIIIKDTAGNSAAVFDRDSENVDSGREGKYRIEILGLSTEETPDYWELTRAVQPIGFIDLDTTELTYSRIDLNLNFQTSHPKAMVLRMDLVSCEAAAASAAGTGEGAALAVGAATTTDAAVEEEVSGSPTISRNILYGGNYPDGSESPQAILILEFNPFNGRELFKLTEDSGDVAKINVEYTCQLRIFSRVGKDAIQAPELQEINVEAPFGFSILGALDENLASKVRDLRNKDWVEIADVLSWVTATLDWIRYIATTLTIITKVSRFIDIVADKMVEVATAYPFTSALRGQCLGLQTGKKTTLEFVEYIQVPLDILSCNPQPEKFSLGWYGGYQQSILEGYNLMSGRGVLGIPANSLYENVFTSAIGLCVPGILFQLEKMRQINCRKIICYAKEVPSGVATLDACDELFDLQVCEFVVGSIFSLTPFGGVSYIGKAIKAALSSPLGLIKGAELLACASLCYAPDAPKPGPGAISICNFAAGFNTLVDITDSVINAIEVRPDTSKIPYCDIAEGIDLDELAGG